ncbi:unnamed protein product [Prunus armeniaca]
MKKLVRTPHSVSKFSHQLVTLKPNGAETQALKLYSSSGCSLPDRPQYQKYLVRRNPTGASKSFAPSKQQNFSPFPFLFFPFHSLRSSSVPCFIACYNGALHNCIPVFNN